MEKTQNRSVDHIRHLNNQSLPSWYSWKIHVVTNIFLLFSSVFLALQCLLPLCFFHGFLFILFFSVWSLIEYFIHRFALHSPVFDRLKFYREHTFFHHGYFNHRFMRAKLNVDINRVLLFPIDISVLILLNALLSYALSIPLGRETALVFFITGQAYIILYESIHAFCHSSYEPNHQILKSLKMHHTLHHHQGHMNEKNFSVVTPFLDFFFKTKFIEDKKDV